MWVQHSILMTFISVPFPSRNFGTSADLSPLPILLLPTTALIIMYISFSDASLFNFYKKFLGSPCEAPNRDASPSLNCLGSKLTDWRPAVRSFSLSHGFQGWFVFHSASCSLDSRGFAPTITRLPALSTFFLLGLNCSSLCLSIRDWDLLWEL